MNPKTPDTTLARRMSALDILYARVRLAQTGFRASAAEKRSSFIHSLHKMRCFWLENYWLFYSNIPKAGCRDA